MSEPSNSERSQQLHAWQIFIIGVSATAASGLSTVFSKDLLAYMPPLTQLWIQLLSSNLFLWIAALLLRSPLPPQQQLLRFGLPGLLHPGISSIFLIVGLSQTSASSEVLISAAETIMTMFLAWLLLREHLSKRLIALSSLAVVGVIMITITPSETTTVQHSAVGNVLILIGTFCVSLYTILCSKLVVQLNPLPLMSLHQSVGFIVVSLVALGNSLWNGATDWNSIRPSILVATGLSGIAYFALTFWLYTIVVKHTRASIAALFVPLIPVFGISGAYLFLGEELLLLQWIGAALILIAVVSVSLFR